MDLYDILLQAGLITSALVLYLIILRRPTNKTGPYREKEWNYIIKYIFARFAVKRWKSQFSSKFTVSEKSKEGLTEGCDGISIRASATDGATVLLGIRKVCGRKPMAEATLFVKLVDGTSYKLPSHPETSLIPWESIEDGWSAGGLKIQILEPEQRLRILYNGLLTNSADNSTQHVRLNLIWCSGSGVLRHPADWSEQLAAHALALDTWRDGSWTQILSKFSHNSWLQFGAVQGTLQIFEEDVLVRRERLRLRGVRERDWSRDVPRRALTLTAVAKDGTAVMLRGLSYKNVFNELMSGCVRFPDYTIKPVTATDLTMSEFCETPEGIPKVYAITVIANRRSLKVVLRVNDEDVRGISCASHKQDIVYRTLAVEINGEHGTGILELAYQLSDKMQTLPQVPQINILKWLSGDKAGAVGYCLSFEDNAAACPTYVGGKGASLALLASVQNDEGYKVPPGFCLTTKALERQLEVYPQLFEAIQGIESSNENYDENAFKQKCETAVELFLKTDISEDIKEEVLKYLNDLRSKIKEQNFSVEERFAVRSSGVGEDSEATSAAGQNETVLGCVGDVAVLRAVRRCWASMFAFNSAYYRRQNGQPCACGGGVVVQALARARVAGVLFTRHPLGDPARLLITANYGLGESVVSGSVEPDSIIVKRDPSGLRIDKIDLGSKKERVKPDDDGVTIEIVSEEERIVPCLTISEILKLAKIGVSQEELWGAPRDIEWAVWDDEIYLLQARPITSLERWTEDELLHELDFPIMSDDELLTFANTGEVLPKPLTPLTHDLVVLPLQRGIDSVIGCNGDHYDRSVAVTHNRCALVLYNSVYRRMPREIDIGIRMVEMAVHGHKVADERVASTARHRRRPRFLDRALSMASMFKSALFTKSTMNDTIKRVNEMNLEIDTSDPLEYLNRLLAGLPERMEAYSANHSHTSSASTFTQFIAMSILLEGKEDFTPEHCSEIGVLLSSGDVLSADVPLALADIIRSLEESGKVEEFRTLQPNEAMVWLQRNVPHVHMYICQFLQHHGHRAIMEFDLATKPWALVPEELVKVLQTMPTTKAESKIIKSNAEIIASLKTPQKSSTRKALRWILPLCHRSVRHREGTKSHLILAIHKLRLSILNLAKLLARHWYLPHPDLIFFFRVGELTDYIKKRNPAILRKAIQRQQLYPSWCKLKFAEVNAGWFDPLPPTGPAVTAGDVTIQATAVCGGEVVGRACVVTDLSEISELQSGDILITHSTDIGWSPYFPLLSGIVTELGGLISHGAVIAREYGLPCIVGATDATSAFTTGNTVRLCATAGTVQRVHLHTDSVIEE